MAGKNDGFRIERKELLADSLKEQGPVSARQIPAPDPPLKKNVPANQALILRKIKAEASGAVAGDVQDPHFCVCHVALPALFQQAIRRKGLDFQIESVSAKKTGVGHHGGRVGVESDFAAVPALDPGRIGRVVEVAVGQQKPVHFFARKPCIGPLRGVEEKVSAGGFQKKCVGVKRAPCKCFELIHAEMV